MPTYLPESKLRPDWLTQPSVMDPMYKRVIRGAADLIGVNDASPAVGNMIATEATKRIAPKRAATELVDLLMGRSKRVPQMVKPLTDDEAKWSALHASRTYTPPPAPTNIKLGYTEAQLNPLNMMMRREPGITAAFKSNQRVLGGNPNKVQDKYVTGHTKPLAGVITRSDKSRLDLSAAAKDIAKPVSTRDLVKKTGSVHAATNQKVLTTKEINSMLQGPKKAVELGVMTKAQANKVLKANMAKIAAQFDQLKKVDQDLYRKAMDERITDAMLRRKQQ